MSEVTNTSSAELLASGRRHLAVRNWSLAVETLADACELLAKENGDFADQCAEAYLWYGKSLLGLSREESGVFGDGMAGDKAEEGNENDEDQDGEENGEEENGEQGDEAEAKVESTEENGEQSVKENGEVEKSEAESTTKDEEPGSSTAADAEPGTSNGDVHDESVVNMDNEDDVDNLQLAWEMLDMSRSILQKRTAGDAGTRSLLADVHLALGEVALESETYDKAVSDMQSCLEIQKELYRSDDRRIAETHYQIGLANSLASNFEEAITHFKNAANILESRIKLLENPSADDAAVQKLSTGDNNIEAEIKELKELLPEIQEKIQDMMDYKAETKRRVMEALSSNGTPESSNGTNGAGASTSQARPVSDISHLVKRKRKPSETEDSTPPAKKTNT